jgi:hypothetical protein
MADISIDLVYQDMMKSIDTNAVSMPPAVELISRGDAGDHKECGECPYAFECLMGSLEGQWRVASTREEHKTGIKLFCIDEGKVTLMPYVYTFATDLEDIKKAVQEIGGTQPFFPEEGPIWIAPDPQSTGGATWTQTTTDTVDLTSLDMDKLSVTAGSGILNNVSTIEVSDGNVSGVSVRRDGAGKRHI